MIPPDTCCTVDPNRLLAAMRSTTEALCELIEGYDDLLRLQAKGSTSASSEAPREKEMLRQTEAPRVPKYQAPHNFDEWMQIGKMLMECDVLLTKALGDRDAEYQVLPDLVERAAQEIKTLREVQTAARNQGWHAGLPLAEFVEQNIVMLHRRLHELKPGYARQFKVICDLASGKLEVGALPKSADDWSHAYAAVENLIRRLSPPPEGQDASRKQQDFRESGGMGA